MLLRIVIGGLTLNAEIEVNLCLLPTDEMHHAQWRSHDGEVTRVESERLVFNLGVVEVELVLEGFVTMAG